MAKIFKLRFWSDLFKRLFASALPIKVMKKSGTINLMCNCTQRFHLKEHNVQFFPNWKF